MKAVRGFRLVTAGERAAVALDCHHAITAWATDWTCRRCAPTCSLEALTAPALAEPHGDAAWWTCEGARGTVWVPQRDVPALAPWVYGTDEGRSCDLGTQVLGPALEALLAALCDARPDAGVRRDATSPAHLLRPGHGALVLRLSAPAQALTLVLLPAPRSSPTPRPDRAPLTPLPHALAPQRVQLQASPGGVDICLGDLRTLTVGDVLRLDRPLDAGMALRLDGHPLPCSGDLVASDGRLAVELVRS